MKVEFTNPRVAKEFIATDGYPDRVVHIPKIYMGLLSNISFAGALKMVERKSNLINRKQPVETEQPPVQAPETEKQSEE